MVQIPMLTGFWSRCARPSRHGGQTLGRPSCWEPVALRVRSLPGFKTRAQRIFLSPTVTVARAKALQDELGDPVRSIVWDERAEALDGAALIVNTTSLGMEGQPPLDLKLDALPPDAVVYDIVYVPLETPLLAAARARGNPAVDGLGMLLHQARPGFRDWFGTDPEVGQVLRDHVLEAL